MKYEKAIYEVISNEVNRITDGGRFINTYGLGILGAEMACRDIAHVYYNNIFGTVNFIDKKGNYVSATTLLNGSINNTDGSPSSIVYSFAENMIKFAVKHFTKEFIEYIDKLCDEMRSIGYNIACSYGSILVTDGNSYVCVSVTDILYAKSLGLSADSLPFAEIVSGTELGKLEADIAVLVEKIMKG